MTNYNETDLFETSERKARLMKHRRLEIIAELAEMKRLYVVENQSSPYEKKVTLEAEYAKIAAEENLIREKALKEKVLRRIKMDESLLYQLLALLKDKGMSAIVDEAKDKSKYVDASYFKKEKDVEA